MRKYPLQLLITLLLFATVRCSEGRFEERYPTVSDGTITFSATDPRPLTRATTPTPIRDFVVSGIWTNTSATDAERNIFNATVVTRTETGSWDYSPKQGWPATGGIEFFAYAPAGSINLSSGFKNKIDHTVEYTVPVNPNDQEDFRVAVSAELTTNPVELHFQHALAAVLVRAKCVESNKTLKVTKLELRNVLSQGKLELEADGSLNYSDGIPTTNSGFRYDLAGVDKVVLWENQAVPKNYGFNLTDGTAVSSQYVQLTSSSDGVFVLPQPTSVSSPFDPNADFHFHVEYVYTDNTADTLKRNIYMANDFTFEIGRLYTFYLTLGNSWAGSNIYFNSSSLTFAEPALSQSDYQGVFFKWGSLIGISAGDNGAFGTSSYLYIPDLATGQYYKVQVSTVTAGHAEQAVKDFVTLIGDLSAGDSAAWAKIPTANGAFPTDVNSQVLYPLTNNKYTGDICKFLSAFTPSGLALDWRMPSTGEFGAVTHPMATPPFTALTSVSPGAISDEGVTGLSTLTYINPGTGEEVIFPISGLRNRIGALSGVNTTGNAYYWSGSGDYAVITTPLPPPLRAGPTLPPDESTIRQDAYPVRCVRK